MVRVPAAVSLPGYGFKALANGTLVAEQCPSGSYSTGVSKAEACTACQAKFGNSTTTAEAGATAEDQCGE